MQCCVPEASIRKRSVIHTIQNDLKIPHIFYDFKLVNASRSAVRMWGFSRSSNSLGKHHCL